MMSCCGKASVIYNPITPIRSKLMGFQTPGSKHTTDTETNCWYSFNQQYILRSFPGLNSKQYKPFVWDNCRLWSTSAQTVLGNISMWLSNEAVCGKITYSLPFMNQKYSGHIDICKDWHIYIFEIVVNIFFLIFQ